MSGAKFDLKNFSEPPEKVRLMFQAVNDFLNEKTDIGSLTVQDITARAGIGKGTAYEYFSSKEELITLALLYDYSVKIGELKALMDGVGHFRDKIFCIMDWLHDSGSYHMTFLRMLHLSAGGQDLCQTLRDKFTDESLEGMRTYLLTAGDAIMEQGYLEGVFAETDSVKRRLAFATMVFQIALTLGEKVEQSFFSMEYTKMREHVYQTMVRSLEICA